MEKLQKMKKQRKVAQKKSKIKGKTTKKYFCFFFFIQLIKFKQKEEKHHVILNDDEKKKNKPPKSSKNKENELKIIKCEKEIVEKAKEVYFCDFFCYFYFF